MKKIGLSFLVVFTFLGFAFANESSPALEQSASKAAVNAAAEAAPASSPTSIPTLTPTSTPTPAAISALNTLTPLASSIPSNENQQATLQSVPAISQLPELPNGCEAVAATMLLNWAGVPVTKEEVAAALPRGPMPYENEDGAFVGGNPQDVFVGDPFGIGYGIYHKPIAHMMEQWLPGRVKDISGASFEELLAVISSGRPAMVWATEHMDTPYLDLEWQDEDDQLVKWYQPEHALLLTSWDEDAAYLNDPMTGKRESYGIADFKSAWELMGSQAIIVNN
ncbi:C39 family peptidase [Paenibacillus alba]|uniref:C39 family peptidase n=1 Tax=Paenibacillus alba TaxID=1197127 RepID=UPI001564D461|nr:C39 family peptidase [Paenibacillus alba]NQX70007.1 C39 family peptidase [Paenibacillus alba]